MLKLIKRISRSWHASRRPAPAGGNRAKAEPPRWSASLLDPLPLAAGNEDEEAEWEQWETSRMGLDGQMQDLAPSRKIRGKDQPGAFGGLGALARFGRKRTT